ncbi:MAG: crosslink repair DNA glycosylase YcaQ family protein [Bacteroidota bacterium]
MKKSNNILSPEAARELALKSQGLLKPALGKGNKGTLAAIEHLGYIQIDTLSVVTRAHHHALWSRLPDYNEIFLSQLLEQKSIFEYWAHAASYLPMSDYRFSLPRKRAYADGKSHWFGQDKKMNDYVFDRIKAEGPLQSKDFEHKREGPGNWYEWKPAKKALEQLFMEGRLMVAKRQGFQKVYDLTERVLPSSANTSFPSEQEMAEHLVMRAVQAHGIVTENEIYYLRSGLKVSVNKALKRLLEEAVLTQVKIKGLDQNFLMFTEQLKKRVVQKKNEGNATINFLSPFDNAIIQRKRTQSLFDFDYGVECYLPEAKRKYGYFTLPVLFGNTFVARFDPKADRANKTFYIKSMHFEKGFKPDENFNNSFAEKLKGFAVFNNCSEICIDKADAGWKRKVTALLH